MAIESYDSREFKSTYFALRIGLIFSAALVLLAPLSVLAFEGSAPPSISDSWYTDARTIFVLGLAAGACLLVVVRGDTLTEQVLLNVAGGLGLLVAGAACWPKDGSGESLGAYDPDVARLNEYAVGALLATALTAWAVGTVLPSKLVGSGWNVSGYVKWALQGLAPALVIGGLVAFVKDRTWLAEHIHGPAAVAMFVLLGCVALLRTTLGVKLLMLIGDTPVDDSLSSVHIEQTERANTRLSGFDAIYTAVAIGMVVVVVVAAILASNEAKPGLVLIVEALLLG
ncbi:hypothetical protein, partial [Nocardioides sp. GCM10030258]|uniref:hypothetical protein n=1 Tax=unclassified Nocardioides TaxID=2615069 RepID=UPI0036108C76